MTDITQIPEVAERIRFALSEDIGSGDATTLALVNPAAEAEAVIVSREPCAVSGCDVARFAFQCVDPDLKIDVLLPDGSRAAAGDTILRISGKAASILTGERVALNFMQRMCGISTMAAKFVDAVSEYGTLVLDTRKTTPGLRIFEKYAVTCGGGTNHRVGLYDRILMKDNHRKLWHDGDADRLDLAVEAARKAYPSLEIEVEVETLEECRSALKAKPEWLLLDNMSCEMMRECVAMAKGISRTEASGNITLARAPEVAATGVDAFSVGGLTHSVRSVDLSLEIVKGL